MNRPQLSDSELAHVHGQCFGYSDAQIQTLAKFVPQNQDVATFIHAAERLVMEKYGITMAHWPRMHGSVKASVHDFAENAISWRMSYEQAVHSS